MFYVGVNDACMYGVSLLEAKSEVNVAYAGKEGVSRASVLQHTGIIWFDSLVVLKRVWQSGSIKVACTVSHVETRLVGSLVVF